MSLLGSVLVAFTLYAVLRLGPTPLGVFGLVLSSTFWTLFFLLVEVPAVGLVLLMTRLGSRAGDLTMPAAAGVPIGGPPPPTAAPTGAHPAPTGPAASTPAAPTEAGAPPEPPASGTATPPPDGEEPPRS